MIYDPLGQAPPLYADGVHDDTEAIQWYIDVGRGIPSGDFHISKSLVFGKVHFSPRLKLSVLAIYSAFGIEFGPIRKEMRKA